MGEMDSKMNVDNIRALAEIIDSYGLTSIEYSDGGLTVQLKKAAAVTAAVTPGAGGAGGSGSQGGAGAIGAPGPAGDGASMTADSGAGPGGGGGQGEAARQGGASGDGDNLKEVVSPFVGVFYSAPSPDSEPFVGIGAKVGRGDILCVIETMKLMNEIPAEQDGVIVDICVKNEDIVEYGQVLFKMA